MERGENEKERVKKGGGNRLSEGSLVRRIFGPKGRWSEGSLVRKYVLQSATEFLKLQGWNRTLFELSCK